MVSLSTHFMNDIIAFFCQYIILTSNQVLQKRKKAIYFLLSEQQHMHKIFSTLTFQELLANKHHKLRDFTFGRVTAWETKKTSVTLLITPSSLLKATMRGLRYPRLIFSGWVFP